MDSEQYQHLATALDRVAYLANRDCDCYSSDNATTTDDSTSCDVCQAKIVSREIKRALTPHLEGLHPSRMCNYAERIYVEQWRKENASPDWREDPIYLLRMILQPSGQKDWLPVTARDAMVATTVVQWLGTNCGRCFMENCERLIREERKQHDIVGLPGIPVSPTYQIPDDEERRRTAHHIATTYVSIDKHPDAARALENAILGAIMHYQKPLVPTA